MTFPQKLTVFGREFTVESAHYEDRSNFDQYIDRRLYFRVDGQDYEYAYTGTKSQALAYVWRIEPDGREVQVYSPYADLENGSYLQELGRRISVELKN